MSRIEVRELSKQWGRVRAVDRVSFQVPEGTLCVLLGPSGCGKSTILRLIAGLESVSSGAIRIAGRDVIGMDPAKRGVSMVFQSYALFPHLDVRENILFSLKVRKVSPAERDARLKEAAHMVGLEDLLNRKPAQLSGGQRQRVALARSIVSRRPVCLMDEPLSNLDAKLRAEMRDEIRTLQQKLGLTMIYVTHDQVEAMTMADQVVLLKDGRIEQIGRPWDLYERPATVFAARFMGSPPMNLLPIDLIRDRDALVAAGSFQAMTGDHQGWHIGVRPEHIRITDEGLPVRVASADYLGAETMIRLDDGEYPIFAKTDGGRRFTPGEQYRISWSLTAIHVF
ncbi:MAG TPA: ABC transporter ATP-binding protein, partial [Desulfosarcina sp.]|nr:ABC transporter ATP-binding protein [Desulfosarcina sp.]